jgi:hypothetical protein
MDEEKNGLNDGNGDQDSRIQARTPCRRTVARRGYWMCERPGLVCGPAMCDQQDFRRRGARTWRGMGAVIGPKNTG